MPDVNVTKDTDLKEKKVKEKKTKEKKVKEKKIKEKKVKLTKEEKKAIKAKKKTEKHGFMLFSIRNKITLCFMIPVIFMVIVGLSAYSKSQKGMSQNYLDATTQTIEMTAQYIDTICGFVNSTSVKLATDSKLEQMYMGLYDNDSVSKLNIYSSTKTEMVSNLESNEFEYAIHIIPTSRNDCLSSVATATVTGMLSEYLESQGVDNRNVPRWIEQHDYIDGPLGSKLDKYILANQVISPNKVYLVVIDVNTDTVRQFLSGLDLGEGSIVGYVTKSGREVICGAEQPAGGSVFYDKDFYNVVKSGSKSEGVEQVKYNGKDYYFMYNTSSLTEASVCALIPVSVVIGQANEIRDLTVILVIVAIIVAMLFGLGTVGSIQGNMKRISRRLEDVSKGDLTVNVQAKGHDEFRLLAGSATNMVFNTKKLVNKVNGATEELADSTVKVSEVSEIIDAYSRDITDAIGEINQGMARQSTHAIECVEKTDVLSEEIKRVSGMLEQVEGLVTETEKMIASGIETVSLLGERAHSTTDITKEVSESINTLKDETEIINSFVATITDISEQTNLLSLNASIEAARAGESGRGFAVVAEEIRKLAEISASAASEIGRKVDNISSRTEASVESANTAQNMVALQSQSVDQAIDIFSTMQATMEELVASLREIVDGIEKADSKRKEAVSAVNNISSIIETETANAEAVGAAADMLLSNVEKLNDTAVELSKNMDDLKTEIAVFKI